MSIDPTLFSGGDVSGIISSLSDLDRRVTAMESARTYIGASTISGGAGGQIVANSVTAAEILTGSLTASSILTTFLSTGGLVVGTAPSPRIQITTSGIYAYSADVGGLPVEKLGFDIATGSMRIAGAITAQSNSAVPITYVTSGNIVSGTIITIDPGGMLQTAASYVPNGRVVLDNAGLRTYNTSGNLTTNINNFGATITAGTIGTAASGTRVEMASSYNGLKVYVGTAQVVGLDGTSGLQLTAPDVAYAPVAFESAINFSSAISAPQALDWKDASGNQMTVVYGMRDSGGVYEMGGIFLPAVGTRKLHAQIGSTNAFLRTGEDPNGTPTRSVSMVAGVNYFTLQDNAPYAYLNHNFRVNGSMRILGTSNPLVVDGTIYADSISSIREMYPGRIDTYSPGNNQTSWYLGSHGAYGLYSNTGLYLAGGLYPQNGIDMNGSLVVRGVGVVNFDNAGSGVSSLKEQYGIYAIGNSTHNLGTTGCAIIGLASGHTGGISYNAGWGYFISHVDYSDRSHKTNVRDWFTSSGAALARVRGLRPRRFDFIHADAGNDVIGLVAQEVEAVDPELVTTVTMPDGVGSQHATKTLSPMSLITLLVAAVQEASAEVADLRTRIDRMENAA